MSSNYTHYFIRHAHRAPFSLNDWGHEVSITLQGQKRSREFGKQIAQSKVEVIWSSPIKRCIQTAEEIKNGIGVDIPTYQSILLGDPGFMILNPKIAEKAFQNDPLVEIIKCLLDGKSMPGFYSVTVGCDRMLRKLLENKQSNQIWISHDIHVCLLTCYIFKSQNPERMMPTFLEGLTFSFENLGVFAHFRGLRTKIDETSLRGS
ncbi:hypothetical protein RHABOEDO_000213 [Candidatus Rhabdochlamydia oedothoracis]|uniref:Uncharacterized protein n=1 Tax=Candidatus Rhabdochlamydia oedothoracis TaxID=2720720 RepID=A0ABX8V4Z5_9BACT|nr:MULTISPECIES: histidine phosphatase family protein [Rhabdochlamydia]KAG6559964.1 hypothetical protein RHOW815_000045 [Candidatus Rhabdochlamydia sp. W815]MCL6756302.1 histidine phosphatase family protein [Candidatus Rhabdochlamydia oedothoracis]QYF48113.1 hypothetical protein RHABOEDO_000213 [Candidatus Rhabdochlamydia oedothoracis]